MNLGFECYTGRPSNIYSRLIRVVSSLTRTSLVRRFKIGITNNPRRRWRKYENFYDDMVVVYGTTSVTHVFSLECSLIDHNFDVCENIRTGGGGRVGDGPYYLYVVRKFR